MTRPRTPFWSKVDRSGGPDACWPWTGGTVTGGYGLTKIDNRQTVAHRFAWESTNGPVPAGLEMRHLCHNPPCCNPTHLRPGTHAENMRESYLLGRIGGWRPHGSANPSAKLTRVEVDAIRAAAGESYASLGRRYSVDPKTIRKIVTGTSWRMDTREPRA